MGTLRGPQCWHCLSKELHPRVICSSEVPPGFQHWSHKTVLPDKTFVRIVKAALLIKISPLPPTKALSSFSRNKSTEAAVLLPAGPSHTVGLKRSLGVISSRSGEPFQPDTPRCPCHMQGHDLAGLSLPHF